MDPLIPGKKAFSSRCLSGRKEAMRRIVYGVNGVGLGHATASKRIVDDLLQEESDLEVVIYSSMAALDFFRDAYWGVERVRVEETWGIDAQMRRGRVSVVKTGLHLLPHLWRKRQRLEEMGRWFRQEGISLVITDFEHYTPRAARLVGIPMIAFSHSLFLRFLHLHPFQLPPGMRGNYLLAKNTVRHLYPLGRINIVNTFYPFPHQEEEGVFFLGPILQREALAVKELIAEEEFVLVYPKPPNEHLFLEFIRGIGHLDFIFYVRRPERFPEAANIQFKAFSTQGFLRDLARCRFVLSTAGHQLPCEALFLRKPMIVVPEGGQFEQYYNGRMLEEMGLGISVSLREMKGRVISDFADRLDDYRQRLQVVTIEDATPAALGILRRELARLPSA
jgi:uncharacterized protein (TIGR00661 family)